MIEFSVVIPTYNQCQYLKKAINSVLKQTYKNFEIIVIDNFSKDKTREIVNSFKSSKIIYKKFNNNGVIGRSRNLGISLAQGIWIAFLDSDDWWEKKKLEIIFQEIKKNNKHTVFCSDELIVNSENKKKKIWRYGPFKRNFYNYLLIHGNCVSTSASVVNRNFIYKKKIFFNENKKFVTAEDYDFFLNIAKNNGKFKFINIVLGKHLMHSKSMSSNYYLHRKSIINVLDKHFYRFKKNFLLKKILKLRSLFVILTIDIKFFLLNKQYLKAFLFIIFILIIFPDRFFAWLKNKIVMIYPLKKNNIKN